MDLIDRGPPPWKQIAAILRGRIADGTYTGRLPSANSLAQEFGVARGTARKALVQLKDDGLIETDRGWGSYVAGSTPPRNP